MKPILIIVLLLASFTTVSFSQTDYIRYNIDNVGYILISPKMELQSGDYKQGADILKKSLSIEVSGNKIVFQQKGVNELNPTALNSYARILIETVIGVADDFEKQSTKMQLTVNELQEFSSILKKQFLKQFENSTMKLILWHGASVEKVNNQPCLKYSYVRQLGNNAPVQVAVYIFHNYDRSHTITLSYRKKEEDIWKESLNHCLNSFKIENIR